MKTRHVSTAAAAALAIVTLSALAWLSPAEAAKASDKASIERGRYIAKIAGCNDCHTAGYAMSGGKTPEREWLTGDGLGWKGPWGTTYPSNLRIVLGKLTEDQWVQHAKTARYRPPMPWFALHDMSEQDLRAFHRFVRTLGPAGLPAPAYVPPGKSPSGPVITFPQPPAEPQKAASR